LQFSESFILFAQKERGRNESAGTVFLKHSVKEAAFSIGAKVMTVTFQ